MEPQLFPVRVEENLRPCQSTLEEKTQNLVRVQRKRSISSPVDSSSCFPEEKTQERVLGPQDRQVSPSSADGSPSSCQSGLEAKTQDRIRTQRERSKSSPMDSLCGLIEEKSQERVLGPSVDQVVSRLDAIQKRLEGLGEMPLHMKTVIDSLASVNGRLSEVQQSLDTDYASESKTPPSSQSFASGFFKMSSPVASRRNSVLSNQSSVIPHQYVRNGKRSSTQKSSNLSISVSNARADHPRPSMLTSVSGSVCSGHASLLTALGGRKNQRTGTLNSLTVPSGTSSTSTNSSGAHVASDQERHSLQGSQSFIGGLQPVKDDGIEEEGEDAYSSKNSMDTTAKENDVPAISDPSNSPVGKKVSAGSHFGRAGTMTLAVPEENGTSLRSSSNFYAESEPTISWFILQANSIFCRAWDVIMIISIFIAGILIPMKHAYVELGIEGTILLHIADFLWMMNILINSRTAFIEAGVLVQDTKLIFWRYMRSWLGIDLLAAWPLVLLPKTAWSSALIVLRLLRLIRLQHLLSKLQAAQFHALLIPFRMLLSLFLTAHVICCLWRNVQRIDHALQDSDVSPWDAYVLDLYWVFMTLTTVGYGDVVPEGTKSRLFTIAIMLCSPFVSGTIVSVISHAMKNLFDDKIENRVADAARFMKRRGIGHDLQRRVEHNLRLHLSQQNRLDPELFEALSPAVQRELSLALLGSTVLRFPLFTGAQHSFVADLAQMHTWVQCAPGDLVAEEGQVQQELVFVVHGRLLMQKCEDDLEVEIEIGTGAWFGEACLFEDDCVHSLTVVATMECELAVLPAVEYHRIVQKYPRLFAKHNSLATSLKEDKLMIKELAYRPPSKEKKQPRKSMFARILPTAAQVAPSDDTVAWHAVGAPNSECKREDS